MSIYQYDLSMADFLKIFFVLCGLVIAFVFGRNYGEKTITESKEYIKMRSDSASTEISTTELANLKTKFQDLLDSSDLKKADDVLSKIMTIFLADLSLHLSEDKQKDLAVGKAQCVPGAQTSIKTEKPVKTPDGTETPTQQTVEAPEAKPNPQIAKFKSNEWLLVNSRDDSEIRRNLKKIELKDIDAYLKDAPETSFKDTEKYFGTYKGRVIDVNNNEYGLLSINLKSTKNKHNENLISGSVILFKNGREVSNSSFDSPTFGFNPTTSSGIVFAMGPRRMLQLYLVENTGRLAGYMYERLPNGTTKTIGTFILNRVDQF